MGIMNNDKDKKYGQDRQTEGQKDNLNKDKKNEQHPGQKYGQEKPSQQNPQDRR